VTATKFLGRAHSPTAQTLMDALVIRSRTNANPGRNAFPDSGYFSITDELSDMLKTGRAWA